MMWQNDLPETWEEAPDDPPAVETPEPTEFVRTDDGGVLLQPTEDGIPDGVEGTRSTHTLYCSAPCSPSNSEEETETSGRIVRKTHDS